jgi:hypothetical protein
LLRQVVQVAVGVVGQVIQGLEQLLHGRHKLPVMDIASAFRR